MGTAREMAKENVLRLHKRRRCEPRLRNSSANMVKAMCSPRSLIECDALFSCAVLCVGASLKVKTRAIGRIMISPPLAALLYLARDMYLLVLS